MSPRDRLAYALLGLGLVQMVGFAISSRAVRGLGAATVASPLPLVFSDVRGVETFASRFALTVDSGGKTSPPIPVTPALYARFGGPYNRRNVYGAAISYGPVLPKELWSSVLHHGFCDEGPLARELGLGSAVRSANVEVRTETAGRNGVWELGVSCGH